MVSYIALFSFFIALLITIISGISILLPLLWGVIAFSFAAVWRGLSIRKLPALYLDGIRSVRSVLLTLTVASLLTASWRLGGTIPYLICTVVEHIDPTLYFLWVYLLATALSSAIGSAISTVCMLGTICMVLAQMAGLNELITAGAVLSGIATGSRWSPYSPAQVLVSSLTTPTMIVFKDLWRTAFLPMLGTCILYVVCSLSQNNTQLDTRILDGMRASFTMSPWLALPLVVQLILALLRVKTALSLFITSMIAFVLAFLMQNAELSVMAQSVLHGYTPPKEANQLAGGGIPAMFTPFSIILLASPYPHLLKHMGIIDTIATMLPKITQRFGINRTLTSMGIIISCFACNPVLTIMTLHPLSKPLNLTLPEQAVMLITSALPIGYLIPWSLTCIVPFSFLGTDLHCLPYAFFPVLITILTCLRRDDILMRSKH